MNDTDLMPFGKYKGIPMQDVPVGYLHWFWHQGCSNAEVKQYIQDNLNALKQENKDLIWTK